MTSDGLKQLLERNDITPTGDKKKDIATARELLKRLTKEKRGAK
jgi:hypothetical protein